FCWVFSFQSSLPANLLGHNQTVAPGDKLFGALSESKIRCTKTALGLNHQLIKVVSIYLNMIETDNCRTQI
ncbi:hypothetical protein M9194_21610, partial [Vibrio sp. S4M6]|uniref:hypothetical protein n=1 Tax=Vibrio sinus TaxID=2946865 RepID=UPI00202A220C